MECMRTYVQFVTPIFFILFQWKRVQLKLQIQFVALKCTIDVRYKFNSKNICRRKKSNNCLSDRFWPSLHLVSDMLVFHIPTKWNRTTDIRSVPICETWMLYKFSILLGWFQFEFREAKVVNLFASSQPQMHTSRTMSNNFYTFIRTLVYLR